MFRLTRQPVAFVRLSTSNLSGQEFNKSEVWNAGKTYHSKNWDRHFFRQLWEALDTILQLWKQNYNKEKALSDCVDISTAK